LSHSTISFLVLGGAVVLFVWGRIPVEMVAVGAALTLYVTGVLSLPQSLAGFSDPAVLFIASLFVVSEGLDASGVTAWAGRELIRRAGGDRTKLLVAAAGVPRHLVDDSAPGRRHDPGVDGDAEERAAEKLAHGLVDVVGTSSPTSWCSACVCSPPSSAS
jgi:hypothetical protein